MRKNVLALLAKQVLGAAFSNKAVLVLMALLGAFMLYATITGVSAYRKQTENRLKYQKEVREHWEEMPDKHPHRMAHYGYIAFRTKHPLSIFDFGTESYTGNVVFLEAHKQNSINLSEAGFSTGLLRFGEIHLAAILQMLVSLILFFTGFGLIAADRENGTLKLLLSQGVSWQEIIMGKSLGLLLLAICLLVPAFLMLTAGLFWSGAELKADHGLRLFYLLLTYLFYFAIISLLTVIVSAIAKKARHALIALIGIWLLLAVILPRSTQAIGTYIHPSPSRIAFEAAVEKDILQLGDSHDPDDPYFKSLKDSVLKAHNASTVEELPFNYSGFQMKEGERMSAEVYNRHLARLLQIYQEQNNVSRISAFINPFTALRNISMALSGSDFRSYVQFQQQAEEYRYKLAQHMNELQIKLISNKKLAPGEKPYSISSEYWKAFPDFKFKESGSSSSLAEEALSIAALLFWTLLLLLSVPLISKKLKAL